MILIGGDAVIRRHVVPRQLMFHKTDPVRLKNARGWPGQVVDVMDDGESEVRYLVAFESERAPDDGWYRQGELELDVMRASDELWVRRQPTGVVVVWVLGAVALCGVIILWLCL